MSEYLIGFSTQDCMVGSVPFSGTREEAETFACKMASDRQGLVYDVSKDRKVPIVLFTVAEVVAKLKPEFRLVPQSE